MTGAKTLIRPTDAARRALTALGHSDMALGRGLSFCLMFETPQDQQLGASILEFAGALDAALFIPSESMLAAIRVQWWADALAKLEAAPTLDISAAPVPLIAQLQQQIIIDASLHIQLQQMVEIWQAACYEETKDSGEGWALVWQILAQRLGHNHHSDAAADIGHALYHLGRRDTHAEIQLKHQELRNLRYDKSHQIRPWLYLAGCLSHYLARHFAEQNANPENTDLAKTGSENPLLVWHMLKWRYFGPPK